ncbi:MAG: hypothetical protein R3F55_06525 [Alphaproteobacteria bacterium]
MAADDRTTDVAEGGAAEPEETASPAVAAAPDAIAEAATGEADVAPEAVADAAVDAAVDTTESDAAEIDAAAAETPEAVADAAVEEGGPIELAALDEDLADPTATPLDEDIEEAALADDPTAETAETPLADALPPLPEELADALADGRLDADEIDALAEAGVVTDDMVDDLVESGLLDDEALADLIDAGVIDQDALDALVDNGLVDPALVDEMLADAEAPPPADTALDAEAVADGGTVLDRLGDDIAGMFRTDAPPATTAVRRLITARQ